MVKLFLILSPSNQEFLLYAADIEQQTVDIFLEVTFTSGSWIYNMNTIWIQLFCQRPCVLYLARSDVESVVIHWAHPLSALRCRFDFWLFLLSFVLLYLGKKQKFILVHFSNILAYFSIVIVSSRPGFQQLSLGSWLKLILWFQSEHSLRQSIGSGLYIANLSLWLAWTYSRKIHSRANLEIHSATCTRSSRFFICTDAFLMFLADPCRIGDSLGISADSRPTYVRAVPLSYHAVWLKSCFKFESHSFFKISGNFFSRSYCNCLGRLGIGFAMDALEVRGLCILRWCLIHCDSNFCWLQLFLIRSLEHQTTACFANSQEFIALTISSSQRLECCWHHLRSYSCQRRPYMASWGNCWYQHSIVCSTTVRTCSNKTAVESVPKRSFGHVPMQFRMWDWAQVFVEVMPHALLPALAVTAAAYGANWASWMTFI